MEQSRGVNRSITRPVVLRRSCDQCRARKIGCDRASPCANCSSARVECTHSPHKPRTGDNRRRVLVSANYEQKIDDIAQSVDGIRQLLQGLDKPAVPGVTLPTQDIQTTSTISGSVGQVAKREQEHVVEEGYSLFHAQSKLMGRFVNELFQSRPPSQSNTDTAILGSLESILSSSDDSVIEGSKDPELIMSTSPDVLQLPPQEEALIVLRWATENASCYILFWLAQVLGIDQFVEICQRVYFPVVSFSQFEFIIANSFLAWAFCEYAIVSRQPKYFDSGIQCQSNVLHNVCRLPLVLPATSRTIASLVLGAQHAIDTNQPTLAWTLNSTAANLCQTLRYHRRSSMEHGSQTENIDNAKLFWSMYRLDKALSLRLGRTPVAVEYDIAIPSDPTVRRWTKFADVQARTYNQLYSYILPQSKAVESMEMAGALALDLQMLLDEQHKSSSVFDDDTVGQRYTDPRRDVYLQAERVVYLSVLSLICRMAPSTQGIFECIPNHSIDISRAALDTHIQALGDLRRITNMPIAVNSHINWTIQFTPFLPSIIIFCSIMNDGDPTDLELLENFMLSLVASEGFPRSRTFQMMKILLEIARLYCGVASAEFNFDQEGVNAEFDHYVDMLGIDPAEWDPLTEGLDDRQQRPMKTIGSEE